MYCRVQGIGRKTKTEFSYPDPDCVSTTKTLRMARKSNQINARKGINDPGTYEEEEKRTSRQWETNG
jgi:hypothetical protein